VLGAWRCCGLSALVYGLPSDQFLGCDSPAVLHCPPNLLGEIVDRLKRVRVFGSQHPLARGQQPLHQRLGFRITDELLGDQPSIPTEDGIRFGHRGNVAERFASQAFSDLGQSDSFGVGQPQPRGKLGPQDPIFGARYSFRARSSWFTEPSHRPAVAAI
jgi:hypothetical protein